MNVKEKFLELTKQTYPHGTEEELFGLLPDYLLRDEFGNLYYQIGDKPSTMFTCHLDTASYQREEVNHVINDNMIYSDGSTILGADDKAGVVVLLFMLEKNIPGLYYFFLGEERGCVGSRKVAELHKFKKIDNITKVVSFDRRGYNSVITHQLSGRSCSNEFASELSNELNTISKFIFKKGFSYMPDNTGIYTDSAQFVNIYQECTNISVGYHNEHTKYESQNIEHLTKLCEASVLVNWEKLKPHRDLTKKYDYYDDSDSDLGYGWNSFGFTKTYNDFDDDYLYQKPKDTTKSVMIYDEKFNSFETYVTYDPTDYRIISIKPSTERIVYETERITKLLTDIEIEFDSIKWDGNNCTIYCLSYKDIILTRSEVQDYLSDLNDWIEIEIKYSLLS